MQEREEIARGLEETIPSREVSPPMAGKSLGSLSPSIGLPACALPRSTPAPSGLSPTRQTMRQARRPAPIYSDRDAASFRATANTPEVR